MSMSIFPLKRLVIAVLLVPGAGCPAPARPIMASRGWAVITRSG